MAGNIDIMFIMNISLIDIFNNILYNNIQIEIDSETTLTISIPFKNIFQVDGEYMVYIPGMQVKCVVEVFPVISTDIPSDEDSTEKERIQFVYENYECMYQLASNYIPITDNLYNNVLYSESIDDDILTKISNLEDNMDKINIVSKTITENIITTTDSSSSSITMQPIFFRYNDTTNITLYKEITDRVSINLDSYKSKVDTFFMLINGNYYMELGRAVGGVIFAINGNDLTDAPTTGNYFITDSNYDVVTKGNYTIL